LISKSIKKLNF